MKTYASILLVLALGCTASTKETIDVSIEGSSDTSADGFGPYQGEFEVCDEGPVSGTVSPRTPYHFWSFETEGCDDLFIDLASREGDDTFVMLYELGRFGWEVIDYNDDCRGSLNSCIETALPAGQYLIGASTYEYMRTRRPTAASYDLQVTCNDAGACAPVAQVCGGRGNEACPEGTFCSFPQSAICGWADATGFCRPIPDVCAAIDQPVCGCDGRNYGNTCQAAQHGVSAQYDGVCGAGEGELCGGIAGILCRDGFRCDMSANEFCGADLAGTCVSDEPAPCTREYMPECGCNGVTYNNACERRQAGVPLDHDGACGRVAGEGELCGGIAGFVCERGLLCDMSANTFCGADLAGTCRVDEPRFCPAHYDPVCGCDGVTYSNACQLGVAGAAFDHDGPC